MPTTPQQTGFDVDAARKAGYSDDEILQHLTQSRGFDIQGAVKAGYSKQDIITHLSAQPTQPTETQQVSAGLPQPPTGVVGNPKAAAKTMQPSFFGGAHPTAQQEAGINAALPQVPEIASGIRNSALTGAGAAFPAAEVAVQGLKALPAIGRGLAGSIALGGGGEYLGNKIAGPIGGHVLGGIGALVGGGLGAKGVEIPTSRAGLADWLLGKGESEAGAAAASKVKPNPFEGATSTAKPVGSAPLGPFPESSTTSSTTSTGTTSLKATPPPSVQYVQKFGAPEKGIIVDPNAPPPPINKTLVSYDGKQLLEMAKKGDLDALNELIRNPRGINLREALPNAKFLMEPGRSTRIYGGPGSAKALLPAVGIVGVEFNKLGLADQVTPRQQTTLETAMRGPQWKDFDRSEKIEHIRDILGRK